MHSINTTNTIKYQHNQQQYSLYINVFRTNG